MKTAIYYFTGTGNSLWVARTLGQHLGNASLLSMVDPGGSNELTGSDAVGLVFPVYIWGLPRPVIRILDELKDLGQRYVFAVAVNGGQVANTLVQLQKILKKKGSHLSTGFEIAMPSNYIPWGGPGPEEEQRVLFEHALAKVSRIAESVENREEKPVEKGALWQRMLFTPIYKLSFSKVPSMDKGFWVDDKCNQCGICSKVCPSFNIGLQAGKPVWNHHCVQCLACLQWCPKQAIQYGKKTPKYERYHHPEVRLNDLLKPQST